MPSPRAGTGGDGRSRGDRVRGDALSGRGRGLVEPKRTEAGERLRLRLLRRVAPRFDLDAVRAALGLSRIARDDVIDAVACLVAAARIAKGDARVLPDGAVFRDARGLRMEIVG